MICLNCSRELTPGLAKCPDCGEKVDPEATAGMMKMTEEMLAGLDPTLLTQLKALAGEVGSAEEFANAIMIGGCAKCDSAKVVSCEQDPDIENPCIAHCLDCGAYFCTECRDLLTPEEFATHLDDCTEV